MEKTLDGILWPAVIAVVGFILKALYELYMESRKRKIQKLEDRLKSFYWPLLVKIEKDNVIWESILSKRSDPNSKEYKIAEHIEAEVLSNHDEALAIIENNLYLAEPDEVFIEQIKLYIKNVTIYKAIRAAGDITTFPIELGAQWPTELYRLVNKKTKHYQDVLNKLTRTEIY